eukprot:SAG31_NODE_34770_length_329_cov_1.130435_1_plen_22_part_01
MQGAPAARTFSFEAMIEAAEAK